MRCRIVLDPEPEVRRWVLLHWLDSSGGLNWFGPGEEAQAQALLAELRGTLTLAFWPRPSGAATPATWPPLRATPAKSFGQK